jgi:hypothetical protein
MLKIRFHIFATHKEKKNQMKLLVLTKIPWEVSKYCPFKGTQYTKDFHEGKYVVSTARNGKWNGSAPISGLVCEEHLSEYVCADGLYCIVPFVKELNEGVVLIED